MKVSDYVIDYIAGLGVDKVFCVTGGGAMHLNNALGQSCKTDGVFMLHEQGASIAAEAYARIKEGYGCCLVTSGPGATNALTGLVGAYIDSIPVIFISGQCKRADLIGEQKLRQFGIQEVDILSMVGSYTKYAVQIKEPEDIRYELEKASYIATDGRPGPVWLDIPLDIQASQIDPDVIRRFELPKEDRYVVKKEEIDKTIELINKSTRPVILLGGGIRLAHAVEDARKLYNKLNIPILTSWNGVDLIEDGHPLYFGRPGAVGHRAANIIQQTADLVLTIGSRINLLSSGYNFEGFLKNACHIMVDIDENEMNKKNVHPQLKIAADAGSFIRALLERIDEIDISKRSKWLERCEMLVNRFPVIEENDHTSDDFISTYRLVDELSSQMNEKDVFQFTSSGTSVDISMKVYRVKWGQRAFLTKGLAAMGYDIPASVGSCIASGRRRTICVTGDGSIAMNMQELEVIHRLNLPVKIFVVDNDGYSMILHSQSNNFGRLTGCTDESGLSLPDMKRVAEAFGIKSMAICGRDDLSREIATVLKYDGPVICVVQADINQQVSPKQTNYVREDGQMASRPLEDMSPLLDRDELKGLLSIE